MAALLRRVLSVFLLSTLLAAGTAATAFTAAPALAEAGSATPATPISTLPGHQVRGEHFTRYCVKNYKPNSTVTVTNEKTGKTVKIHTNSHGAGCVNVPVVVGCQVITASGVDTAGDPRTSSATVCVLAKQSQRNNGALPFTGSNIIIPGVIIGLLLIAMGTATTVMVRRRRTVHPA